MFPEKLKDGELIQDKAAKGKAAQPSDKGLDIGIVPQQLSLVDSNPTTKLQPTDAEMGQNWYRKSYDYLNSKEKSIQMDELDGVSQDDESDSNTRQDGCGATVKAKVSGEVMNDANMSTVVHIEETKLAREIVLKNKVELLEAKVKKLQLNHNKMAEFFENFYKIRPELVPQTLDAKEDPSDATIDGEHMDVVGNTDENERPNAKEDPSNAAIDENIWMPLEDVSPSQNTVKADVSSAQKYLNPSLDFIIDKYLKKVVRKPKRSTSTAYIRRSKRHKQGVLSTADNGEVVNEPQLPDSHE
nr:hypothetical protein [Tanacetum cinerariifolium]